MALLSLKHSQAATGYGTPRPVCPTHYVTKTVEVSKYVTSTAYQTHYQTVHQTKYLTQYQTKYVTKTDLVPTYITKTEYLTDYITETVPSYTTKTVKEPVYVTKPCGYGGGSSGSAGGIDIRQRTSGVSTDEWAWSN